MVKLPCQMFSPFFFTKAFVRGRKNFHVTSMMSRFLYGSDMSELDMSHVALGRLVRGGRALTILR